MPHYHNEAKGPRLVEKARPRRPSVPVAPRAYSYDVLIFTGGKWLRGSYQYDEETGNDCSWECCGEVIPAGYSGR
jgi:hypothetical protein